MKNASHFLALLFLFSLTCYNCKPAGKGKMICKVEAQTDKLSDHDEKLIESIYNRRLIEFGIDEKDISIKAEGKIFIITISGISNYKLDNVRMNKILQASAHLSFWETYSVSDISGQLNTCFVNDSLLKPRLPELIIPGSQSVDPHSCCLFSVQAKDTAAVNAMFAHWKDQLPSDLRLMWTAKPTNFNRSSNLSHEGFGLIALKANVFGKARIEQPVITEAKAVRFIGATPDSPEISVTMDNATASMWASMTRANIGKSIAMVVDGYVYSFPTIQNEITGGVSSIRGNFTKQEENDLVSILRVDPMPYPMRIVAENVQP